MPYYTGLARVARKTGYPVVEVAGWKTRGHGAMSGAKSVVVHHTAGAASGNYPSLAVVRDGRAGLPGPLSHYGIGRDGTVYVIAAGLCAHAGRDSQVLAGKYRNRYAIGIEAENTGTGQAWPAAQLDSYVKLCRALADEFKLDAGAIVGHKEIATDSYGRLGRKIDPNFSTPALTMDGFRSAVRRGYWRSEDSDESIDVDPAGSTTKPAKPAAWPDVDLPVTRSHSAASHAAWVRLMAAIGHDDKDLGVALQKWLRAKGLYKRALDGVMGKFAIKALQRFLRSKGLYKGRIDGKRGPMTVRAEINYLNRQRRFL